MKDRITIEEIAEVCHEANRAFCETLGDFTQVSWADAPGWQRESVIDGVRFLIRFPFAPPSASRDNWMKVKRADGWVYGTVKSESQRTHPCMLPFGELPKAQQTKDHLFKAIVTALSPLVEKKNAD